MDYIIGILLLALAAVVFNLTYVSVRYLWRCLTVDKKVRRIDAGIFVDQGMYFDEDGFPKPDKKPSTYANRVL